MVEYKCFDCGKAIDSGSLRRMVRCPYCGGKMLYKPRMAPTKVKAR
jgi:DNA-directed RNA polymerase subunit RPC12/RpoP